MAVASALIGAATSIGGAAIANGGTSKAADATAAAARESAAVQREIYGKNEGYLSPMVAQGGQATPIINGLLGLGDATAANNAFNTYKNSSGYDWRFKQGLNGVTSGFAGGGMLKSGSAMKSLNDYGQGMASQEFGNYLGSLGNQQGFGLSAASALAGVGQNYANSLGSIYQQNGANQASAALVKSQNTANAFGSLAGAAGNIFGKSGSPAFSPMMQNNPNDILVTRGGGFGF